MRKEHVIAITCAECLCERSCQRTKEGRAAADKRHMRRHLPSRRNAYRAYEGATPGWGRRMNRTMACSRKQVAGLEDAGKMRATRVLKRVFWLLYYSIVTCDRCGCRLEGLIRTLTAKGSVYLEMLGAPVALGLGRGARRPDT